MINLCLHDSKPFTVVLIHHGEEALGELAEPYRIGTTARIIQAQRLPDGRMNIVAVGEERVRIVSLERDLQPYLVGYLNPFPLQPSSPDLILKEGSRLATLFDRYMRIASQGSTEQIDIYQLADEPASLAYAAAAMLQISNSKKQEILSLEEDLDLVQGMIAIFRQEIALLQVMLRKGPELEGGFSAN